jgi:hydantoinase/carbamoylase family amidase
VTLKLVDWADEEGARFGYGMLGSSAACGSLDLAKARRLHDREGNALPDVLAACGVDVERMAEARSSLEGALGYIELHIEQGPVLEDLGLPLAVVNGTVGIERNVMLFTGQAAHAGPTPMDKRREALSAAARLLLELREGARAAGGMFTAGRLVTRPGAATIVADEVELTIDQRHPDALVLQGLLDGALDAARRIAAEERVTLEVDPLWRIPPLPFDPQLRELTAAVIEELTGEREAHTMDSGALHDAAEVVRAGVPTVMLFVRSLGGISHTKVEDSSDADLELGIRALGTLVERATGWASVRASAATQAIS